MRGWYVFLPNTHYSTRTGVIRSIWQVKRKRTMHSRRRGIISHSLSQTDKHTRPILSQLWSWTTMLNYPIPDFEDPKFWKGRSGSQETEVRRTKDWSGIKRNTSWNICLKQDRSQLSQMLRARLSQKLLWLHYSKICSKAVIIQS